MGSARFAVSGSSFSRETCAGIRECSAVHQATWASLHSLFQSPRNTVILSRCWGALEVRRNRFYRHLTVWSFLSIQPSSQIDHRRESRGLWRRPQTLSFDHSLADCKWLGDCLWPYRIVFPPSTPKLARERGKALEFDRRWDKAGNFRSHNFPTLRTTYTCTRTLWLWTVPSDHRTRTGSTSSLSDWCDRSCQVCAQLDQSMSSFWCRNMHQRVEMFHLLSSTFASRCYWIGDRILMDICDWKE